jgi:propionyl-CoA carboxylase beta chain
LSLGGYADIFLRNTLASGVVPQISLSWVPCAGGAVYSPAITDVTIMVEGTSYMFVTGPNVVRAVTHEDVDFEGLGGASTHTTDQRRRAPGGARRSAGDRAVPADPRVTCRRTTSSAAARERAIRSTGATGARRHRARRPAQPYDMHDVITRIVDDGEFLELQPAWAANIIVGFCAARWAQRGHRRPAAGGPGRRRSTSTRRTRRRASCACATLQRSAADARRRAGLPARRGQEHGGIIRHGAKLLYAYCRGDGAQGDGHHAQGVRRRLRRHEQQAHPRRHEPRLAHGARSR